MDKAICDQVQVNHEFLKDKIEALEKRVAELEKATKTEFRLISLEHDIKIIKEYLDKEPPKHDVARELKTSYVCSKCGVVDRDHVCKQEPEDSITISRKVAEEWLTVNTNMDGWDYRTGSLLVYAIRQSLSDKKSEG
jgi:hypothetical protein